MSVSSVNSSVNIMSPASAAISRQTPPGRNPTDTTPKEIGDSGSTPFNHQHLIEGMKEKLRAQIMTEKDMDASTLNAMSSEERKSVEAEIGRLVSQKLQETMQRMQQDAAVAGKTEGALLNIQA